MKIVNNETMYSGVELVEQASTQYSNYKLTFAKSCGFIEATRRAIDISRGNIISIEYIEQPEVTKEASRKMCEHDWEIESTDEDGGVYYKCKKCNITNSII